MNSQSEDLYADFTPDYTTHFELITSPSTSTALRMIKPESSMINISNEERHMQVSKSSTVKPSTVTSSTSSATYHQHPSFATFETTSMVRYIPPYAMEEFESTETSGEKEVAILHPLNMYTPVSDLTAECSRESRGWYHSISRLTIPTIPTVHRIHVNPLILLNQHRADFQGIGTPIPTLPANCYFSTPAVPQRPTTIKTESKETQKSSTIAKRSNKKSKKNKRRQKQTASTSMNPKQLAHLILKVQADNWRDKESKHKEKTKNCEKLSNEPPKQQSTIMEHPRKRFDARLWLQAKAQLVAQVQSATNKTNSPIKLQTSSTIKRFVDRATSPIDFKDEQIKPKTHDVALSPIRFIKPNLKRRSNGNSIDLSAQSSPIPLKRKCFLPALEHECSKCKISQPQDKSLQCPTCHAVSALNPSE